MQQWGDSALLHVLDDDHHCPCLRGHSRPREAPTARSADECGARASGSLGGALIVHFLSSSVLGFGLFWEGVSGVGNVSGLNFENIELGQLHVFGFVQTSI